MSTVKRKQFTQSEIQSAWDTADGNVARAAKILSGLGRGAVSPQLCRYWTRELPAAAPVVLDTGPKVLILDIETAPIFGAVWGLFNNFVSLEQIKDDWFIMSYSAKWLHETECMYEDQSNRADMEDDRDLLGSLWNLLDAADVVVAHNGRRFDVKKINARLILNGYHPPSPYRIADTLETARRNFAFTSNKLKYLTDKLTSTKKRDHGKFPGYLLWQQCLKGNLEAWEEMRLYNMDDVLSLEELYLLLLPWDEKAPNFGLYTLGDKQVCPRCGSPDIHKTDKFHRLAIGLYSLHQCGSCHGWSRGRKLLNSVDKRKSLLSGV